MKKLSLNIKLNSILFLFLIIPTLNFSANEIILNGIYKGENIYVENPLPSSKIGFCVTEVLVNGHTTTDEINSSFFEIDLSIYGFKYGDFINIIIKHKKDCEPRILNKEVLTPTSTFEIQQITIDKSGLLKWSTLKEHGSLPFIIEQYRWNKWIKVGAIPGKGRNKLNKYVLKVDFNSKNNKFRIKQIGSDNKARYSESIEYESDIPEITFIPGNKGKASDKIFFSTNTRYEIFNYYGKLMKTGNSNEVNITKLISGTYFLNYDNKTEIFIKE